MIKNIHLKNFRRFSDINLNFNNNLIIFKGNNAVGKTTVLESIFLMSTTKSHRTNDYKQLIKNQEDFSHITIVDEKKYEMIISQKGKKQYINKVLYNKASDFIGNLKVVLFSPDDLDLIKGNKIERRNFLDLNLSMIDKVYLNNIKNYKKLLKERNELLKIYNENKKDILNVLTDELIEFNKAIMKKRSLFINELNNRIIKIYEYLNKEEKIEIKYLPSLNGNDYKKIYNDKLDYDIYTKVTNYGIHRDDIDFIINNEKAIDYGSQGQIRSIAICLKIALFYLIKDKFKESPILLLDDVFSELDNKRQEELVRFLINEPQTFITTTNIEAIPKELINKAQIYNF